MVHMVMQKKSDMNTAKKLKGKTSLAELVSIAYLNNPRMTENSFGPMGFWLPVHV